MTADGPATPARAGVDEDEYRIGIRLVDHQHEQFVALMHELKRACESGATPEEVRRALDGLDEYARVHFTTEEGLMRVYGYPDAREHQVDHMRFHTSLRGLQQRFDAHGIDALELSRMVEDWFRQHVQASDQRLGAFLRDKKLK